METSGANGEGHGVERRDPWSSARRRPGTRRHGGDPQSVAAEHEMKIGRDVMPHIAAVRFGKRARQAITRWASLPPQEFVRFFLSVTRWKTALALVLVLCGSATSGARLLLLVPLMKLVGLDVGQGSAKWLDDLIASWFVAVGLRPTLPTVLATLVALTVAQALIARFQSVYNLKLQQGFMTSVRRRLYRAIAETQWLTFVRSRSADFTHALTVEVDRLGAAAYYVMALAANTIMVLIYIVLAMRLSAIMTVLVFVCGAGLLVMLRRKTREARWTGEEISLATNGLYAAAIEHLAGMKTSKSYGAEGRSAELFARLADRVALMNLNATRNYAEAGFWFQVGSVAVLSTIVYIAIDVLSLSSAALLLLIFLFSRIIPLFASVQQSYQQYLNALPAFDTVMEALRRCEAAVEIGFPQGTKSTDLREGVRYEEVSFTYDTDAKPPVIKDLDLFIEAGKTTAVVGPSGAGKSTLADLLMGLVVPDTGRILVDGTPLSSDRIISWRSRIGYVAQDTFLFNDTVRANLLWACPDASDEDITVALDLAAATEFVSGLPDGLETVLGDRGVRLSGGERQRLALARGLLRKPSLLILDEAASALDSENEQSIQAAIESLHGQTTILVITHRLSAIRDADVIHVLDRGRLVESGSWSDLLGTRDGRFKTLARAQGIGKA